ncbi:MAG: hypothetical protein AVDCRST_MAG64-3465, partial [uncultured Phycisphaerae bacterium]
KTPGPTRPTPTAWWSGSTAASAGRCSASPSARMRSSNGCCAASTPPTTPGASACWTARRRIRSSPSASGRGAAWLNPSRRAPPEPPARNGTGRGGTPSRTLASSLKPPRTSRHRTV